MSVTWAFCPLQVEDEAARRPLRGLAIPQGEVVHGEHVGLVLGRQELPAGRKTWVILGWGVGADTRGDTAMLMEIGSVGKFVLGQEF